MRRRGRSCIVSLLSTGWRWTSTTRPTTRSPTARRPGWREPGTGFRLCAQAACCGAVRASTTAGLPHPEVLWEQLREVEADAPRALRWAQQAAQV